MKPADYPALYRSAGDLALKYQTAFFRAVFWHLVLLVAAAALSLLVRRSGTVAMIQSFVLLGALTCSIYLWSARPDRYWYAARAVAESIKTATWRFVSVAEPFDSETDHDRHNFRNLLQSIVAQNTETAQRLTKFLDGVQITDAMIRQRALPVSDRLAAYLSERIKDQQAWYAKKAAFNRRMADIFYGALILANCFALVFAIARIRYPEAEFGLTDVWISIAGGVLAWIQSKRFSELASSYALAAHEISLIREQAESIHTDLEFSRFVGDAENAFSREHTQWVARKDN